jgi:hypothetical protein
MHLVEQLTCTEITSIPDALEQVELFVWKAGRVQRISYIDRCVGSYRDAGA